MAEINRLSGVIPRTCSDVVVGPLIASFVDMVFSQYFFYDIYNADMGDFKKFLLLWAKVMAQASITTLLVVESQYFLYDPEYVDPTGGMVLIATCFYQPELRQAIDQALEQTRRWIMDIFHVNKVEPITPSPKAPVKVGNVYNDKSLL